jgi:hypothetical protein
MAGNKVTADTVIGQISKTLEKVERLTFDRDTTNEHAPIFRALVVMRGHRSRF